MVEDCEKEGKELRNVKYPMNSLPEENNRKRTDCAANHYPIDVCMQQEW